MLVAVGTPITAFATSFQRMRANYPATELPLIGRIVAGSLGAAVKLNCRACSDFQINEIQARVVSDCVLYPLRSHQKNQTSRLLCHGAAVYCPRFLGRVAGGERGDRRQRPAHQRGHMTASIERHQRRAATHADGEGLNHEEIGASRRRTSRGENPLLAAALDYTARGWSIIPVIGKRAAVHWRRFQTRCPTERELRSMFAQPGITGLAVILGQVSGGLACRDFDDRGAARDWYRANNDLAKRLPKVHTRRGCHYYFRGPAAFHVFGDGEYRGGSGQYCVLPPSQHQDGEYAWAIPLPVGELPRVDPYQVGLLPDRATQRAQTTQRTQEVELSGLSAPRCAPGSTAPSVLQGQRRERRSWPSAVETAIVATQPQAVGQRHRCVFELCRVLKAIPDFAGRDLDTLRPIVEDWHRRALPVIGTKDFIDTWADFVSGWEKVRYPSGDGPVDIAFRRGLRRSPPQKAVELYGDTSPILALASLCRELQRQRAEGEYFPLDCRTASRLLGVDKSTAWRHLKVLCVDGILVAGSKGSRAERKASEFLYVAE